MKLLKIENNSGYYRDKNDEYHPVDKLGKEELLQLVNRTLHEEAVEFDDYDENLIKNQAHQIIYKSVLRKLRSLEERRGEFIDESARAFLEDYERYHAAPHE